jgi:hypothetical protein
MVYWRDSTSEEVEEFVPSRKGVGSGEKMTTGL